MLPVQNRMYFCVQRHTATSVVLNAKLQVQGAMIKLDLVQEQTLGRERGIFQNS